MRILALAALILAAGYVLDAPFLAWAALTIAVLGLVGSAVFGLLVLGVLAAIAVLIIREETRP